MCPDVGQCLPALNAGQVPWYRNALAAIFFRQGHGAQAESVGGFHDVPGEAVFGIYLGIEFASMGSYLLTAFVKGDRKGSEAGLKYVIYGSVASGVMLFGLSLVYGMTGSLYIGEITQELLAGNIGEALMTTATGYDVALEKYLRKRSGR